MWATTCRDAHFCAYTERCGFNTVTRTHLNAGICKILFQTLYIRLTPPPPPPLYPSSIWRKFEKKIQNLLLVISMPGGAWLLSIAPFFQPFDILLDVVCVKVQPRHILFIISEGRKAGKGGVGLLIERVRSCCTQTPYKHCAEFPQVPNVSNYSKFPKQRNTGFFLFLSEGCNRKSAPLLLVKLIWFWSCILIGYLEQPNK